MDNLELYKAILAFDKNRIKSLLIGEISVCMKALALARLSRFSEAEEILSSVDVHSISQFDKQIYCESRLLITHQNFGYETLLKKAKELLSEFPNSFFGNYYCAYIYKFNKDWQESYKHFCKCLETFPDEEILNFEAFSLAEQLKDKCKSGNYRSKISSRNYLVRITLGTNYIAQIVLWLFFLGALIIAQRLGMSLDSIIISIVILVFVVVYKKREILLTKFVSGLMIISLGFSLYYFLLAISQINFSDLGKFFG